MALLPDSKVPEQRGPIAYLPPPPSLSDRERAFVIEYLIDLNATQAAIRAGFSGSSGRNLMKVPAVKDHIDRALAERAIRWELTTENLLRRLSILVNGDRRVLFKEDGSLKSPTEMTEEEAMLIKAVKTRQIVEAAPGGGLQQVRIEEVVTIDQLSAIQMALKQKGLLREQVDVNVTMAPLAERLARAREREHNGLPPDIRNDPNVIDVTPEPLPPPEVKPWGAPQTLDELLS